MKSIRTFTAVAIPLIALAAVFAICSLRTKSAWAASPQGNPFPTPGIVGAWCAQGDSTKQCSIASNGPFLSFTNENGDTSSGNFVGMGQNAVSADQWMVRGNVSQDGSRIDWSNGTYWTRCSGGGGYRTPNLDGTWYRDGNRSQRCSIRQRKKSLRLTNETGQTATGTVDGRRHVTTTWSGTQIGGNISSDGNTINWDNGTSWSR